MYAVLSEQIAKIFEEKTKIKVIPMPPFEKLDAPVSSHADMLICVIENNIFFYREYYELHKDRFKVLEAQYNIILVDKPCSSKYPLDVGLNVLVIGKRIFCNKKFVANEILSLAEKLNYQIFDVKQGYSACSTLVINESSAITGDKGMYIALKNEGIDVLLISPEAIALEGYNHGFIGGSGGIFESTAYFFGEIEAIEEHKAIIYKLEKSGCKIVSVLSKNLFDFGGIKFI